MAFSTYALTLAREQLHSEREVYSDVPLPIFEEIWKMGECGRLRNTIHPRQGKMTGYTYTWHFHGRKENPQ